MKRSLMILALLCPAPVALALDPVPAASPSSNPIPSPVPSPVPSPSEVPIRLQTLVADKNLRLTLTGIGPECRILRVALLRKDAMLPGYGAFNRSVRVDQTLGRVVTLVLGPEFQPHRYGVGDIRLSCFDASSRPVGYLANKAPLALDQSELQVDVGTAFGPGAADDKLR